MMKQDAQFRRRAERLKKRCGIRKAAEASYKVLRLMTTLDVAPHPAAGKIVQRIVGRINQKLTPSILTR